MAEKECYSIEEQLEDFYRSEKRHLREKVLLLCALEKRFGMDVRDIVREERAKSVETQWNAIAQQTASASIKDLIEILWEPMRQRGIVKYNIIESSDGMTCLKVTSCLFAKLVEELNIPIDWGCELYCCDDEQMVKGFNKRMKFSRSKTLMEGHDYCDHCYQMM